MASQQGQQEARDAIYKAVAEVAKQAPGYGGVIGAQMLRDAGIAYRAAVGGAQVGGVFVDGK